MIVQDDLEFPDDGSVTIRAEQALLGCLLIAGRAVLDRIDGLEARDFYSLAHGTIFKAILKVAAERIEPDPLTVGDWLERAGALKDVGGVTFLNSLMDRIPDLESTGEYARIIRNRATRRRLAAWQARRPTGG